MRGSCPRCGRGAPFEGFAKPAAGCDHCGLDLDFADIGDGPAIFVVGFIVATLALIVNVMFRPSVLVQTALWLPLAIGLSIALLRPFKKIVIAPQYRYDAGDRRLNRPRGPR